MEVVAGEKLGLDLLAGWGVDVRGWVFFEGLVDYYVGCLLDRVLNHHWQRLAIFL